jgi:hypothetical protein
MPLGYGNSRGWGGSWGTRGGYYNPNPWASYGGGGWGGYGGYGGPPMGGSYGAYPQTDYSSQQMLQNAFNPEMNRPRGGISPAASLWRQMEQNRTDAYYGRATPQQQQMLYGDPVYRQEAQYSPYNPWASYPQSGGGQQPQGYDPYNPWASYPPPGYQHYSGSQGAW